MLALRDRLIGLSPALAQAAGAFGLIWAGLVSAAGMVANIAIGTVADLHETAAGAERVWSALNSVQNGLGGGNEIVGGVWVGVILLRDSAHRDASRPDYQPLGGDRT